MSNHLVVFVPRFVRLPGADALGKAARSIGYSLRLEDFDPVTQVGGLPGTANEVDGAFEYFADTIADYLDEVGGEFSWFQRVKLRRYASAISFVTHSREDDLFLARIAAAACALSTHGRLLDTSSGRFFGSSEIKKWVKSGAVAPANVGGRKQLAETVHDSIAELLRALSFERLIPPPEDRGDERWYGRPGRHLPHEFVTASAYFDGDEALCSIDYFASRHDAAFLRQRGLSGNVAGTNLFDFQFSHLKRPFESLLPKNIPVDAAFKARTLPQLDAELHHVDESVWSFLETQWRKHHGA